jgi:hypothetical protein
MLCRCFEIVGPTDLQRNIIALAPPFFAGIPKIVVIGQLVNAKTQNLFEWDEAKRWLYGDPVERLGVPLQLRSGTTEPENDRLSDLRTRQAMLAELPSRTWYDGDTFMFRRGASRPICLQTADGGDIAPCAPDSVL